MQNLTAAVSDTINAPPAAVWAALTTPKTLKRYFFGADVESDFEEGSPITFSGEYEGKAYRDRGEILEAEPERRLTYSHYSGASGKPDRPENYHQVSYELAPHGGGTRLTIRQDGNESDQAKAAAEKNWRAVLDGLKECVEG